MGNSVNENTLVAARQFCGDGDPVEVFASFVSFRRLVTGYGLWLGHRKAEGSQGCVEYPDLLVPVEEVDALPGL